MDSFHTLVIPRQEVDATDSATAVCESAAADTSYFDLRVASIFVILVGSALGAVLPVWLARTSKMHVPKHIFFVAKYFGSGVILATAWMHLLSPASDALRNECLEGILPDYDWAMGIGLMTVMAMFLVELVISHFDFGFGHSHDDGNESDVRISNDPSLDILAGKRTPDLESGSDKANGCVENAGGALSEVRTSGLPNEVSYPPGGEDHLGHRRDHVEGDSHADFAAQLTALFILEFGVIFHSIFIGLTLAITDGFIILFIVIVFHQTFEGLGLGSRLATAIWPTDKWWMPYLLGGLYAVTTPIAVAIGLGVRQSLSLDGATALIVNGVFDAVSGGILMYTGLVELLAHEFMFNPSMRKAGLKVQLYAYSCVAVGVALMALLAKWA